MARIQYIAFTMYPVKDMARARAFYENKIGLTMGNNFRDIFVEYYLDNGCFSLGCMDELTPSANAGGSIGFEVDDLDEFFEKLKKDGVKAKMEPFSTPGCKMAVMIDSEGNAFTLHQKNADRKK